MDEVRTEENIMLALEIMAAQPPSDARNRAMAQLFERIISGNYETFNNAHVKKD